VRVIGLIHFNFYKYCYLIYAGHYTLHLTTLHQLNYNLKPIFKTQNVTPKRKIMIYEIIKLKRKAIKCRPIICHER
jgi:hypothetical protein